MAEYTEPTADVTMVTDERVIALIDMDCFYVQVLVREKPALAGKPVAVLQFSDTVPGGTTAIAVSYEARALGVNRGMRKQECLDICPGIELPVMPHHRNKADLSMFRAASSEVMAILSQNATIFERASIDEAYIDITENVKKMIGLPISKEKLRNTYIGGLEGAREDQLAAWYEHLSMSAHQSYDYKLTLGAVHVNMIRAQISRATQFTCSAGIGANKIVAKLAAGTHKPDSQTIIVPANVPRLYQLIHLSKIRNFGGKLGKQIQEELGIEQASELIKFSQAQLIARFGERSGVWIFNIARGHDSDPVKPRSLVKQTGCAKNFPKGITLVAELDKWVAELSEELAERLAVEKAENRRLATQFTTSLKLRESGSCSIQFALSGSDCDTIRSAACRCLRKKLERRGDVYTDTIYMMSFAAGKFVPAPADNSDIVSILKKKDKGKSRSSGKESDVKNAMLGKENTSSANHSTVSRSRDRSSEPADTPGFFEKYNTENKLDSESAAGLSTSEETEPKPANHSTVSRSRDLEPKPVLNTWNSLSEEEQRVMLQDPGPARVRCPTCNKSVLESRLPEHLDFHAALDLQRQFESQFRVEDQGVSPKAPKSKRTLPGSSKNKGAKKQKVSSVPSKNIASFFKKN